MRIKRVDAGLALWDPATSRWVSLSAALLAAPALATPGLRAVAQCAVGGVLLFLQGGEALRGEATALLEGVSAVKAVAVPEGEAPLLPYRPRAFRDFCLYMRHLKQATAGTMKNNPGYILQAIHMVLGRTMRLPMTKLMAGPSHSFLDRPIFYMGNHLNFYPSGATVPWPCYTGKLDYELEMAVILTRDLRTAASPAEALAAVGGFVLINDFSARDVQPYEMAESGFGFPKSKNFATAMGEVVVTADEILPSFAPDGGAGSGLGASVSVNGEVWGESNSGDPSLAHGIGAMVAYASLGEQLHAGELLGMGTIPNCCGLEMNKWLKPGDAITLSVDKLGTLTNTIGEPEDMPTEGIAGQPFRDLSYRKAGPTPQGPSVWTLALLPLLPVGVAAGLAFLRSRRA